MKVETDWPYPLAGCDEPRRLSQSVVQAGELLGLYGAELARVLGLHCGDVAGLAAGRRLLEPGSDAWYLGRRWVRFYDLLYQHLQGDGVAMVHWLRIEQPGLDATPLRLLVDEAAMETVIAWLETVSSLSPGSDRG